MKKRNGLILCSLLSLIFILYSCEFGARDVGLDQSFEMTEEYEFYFKVGADKYKNLPPTIDLKKIIGKTELISTTNIEANILNYKIDPTLISWKSGDYRYSVSGFKITITVLIHIPPNSDSGKHKLFAYFENLDTLGKYLNSDVVFVSKGKHTKLQEDKQVFFHTISIHESTGGKFFMQALKFIGSSIIIFVIVAAIIIAIMASDD